MRGMLKLKRWSKRERKEDGEGESESLYVSGQPKATAKPVMERMSANSGGEGIKECHRAAEGRKLGFVKMANS